MSEGDTASAFTLSDVFKDAFASVRATWALHFAWSFVFLALLFLSCCGVTCLLVPVFALIGIASPAGQDTPPSAGAMAAIYSVFGAAYFVLFTIYESVTLEVTHAHARAHVPSFREAVDRTLRRAPALLGGAVLRLASDLVPAALVVSLGAAVMAVATDGRPSPSARTMAAVAATLAYFLFLAWALFVRAHFGLALSCVVRDTLGPRAAFERSQSLLRGRRWHFLAFRLAYFVAVFAVYLLALTPVFVLALMTPDWGRSGHDDAATWIAVPVIMLVYGLMLELYALDAILVGTYHARLARPLDAAHIAKVFD